MCKVVSLSERMKDKFRLKFDFILPKMDCLTIHLNNSSLTSNLYSSSPALNCSSTFPNFQLSTFNYGPKTFNEKFQK